MKKIIKEDIIFTLAIAATLSMIIAVVVDIYSVPFVNGTIRDILYSHN